MKPDNNHYTSTYPPIELMGTPSKYSYNKELYRINEIKLDTNHRNGFIKVEGMNKDDIERSYVWLLCILYLGLKSLQVPSGHLQYYMNKLSYSYGDYNDYRESILFLRQDPKIDRNIKEIFSIERNKRPMLREFIRSLN